MEERNADFIIHSRRRRLSTILGGEAAVKPEDPPAKGRSILRTFSLTTFGPEGSPPLVLTHHLSPKGSMSLDSQSPTAPYESSSFATPLKRGHNKWGEGTL